MTEHTFSLWLQKLPEDIREAVLSDGGTSSEGDGILVSVLRDDVAPSQIPELVREYPQDVRAFGRARRIRLMAWMAKKTYPDSHAVFRKLTGEEEDGSGSNSETGELFLEDIKIFAEVISKRQIQRMASENRLDAVVETAKTLENEITFSQGGM
ncbi:hypothetical protein ACFOY8_12180 [Thalassospira xianhensis]|nr:MULTISPECIES: hypothetical protein [Thalassospira]RCK06377.1 hypothetical protein TH5_09280 [Thalassospira xianhensis MCCC 1A02616]